MKKRALIFISALVLCVILLGTLAIGVAAADASKTVKDASTTGADASTTGADIVTTGAPGGLRTAVSAYEGLLSPGLLVLSADVFMAKTAVAGNDILFKEEDFLRALNVSELTAIYISKIPPASDGVLMQGDTRVFEGQTISATKLDSLTYVPQSGGAASSEFTYVLPSGCPVTCKLYTISKTNYSPTVSLIASTVTDVSTYTNIPCEGKLGGYDPEGDAVVFDIVTYPKNGALFLTNSARGTYTYNPKTGYTGKDSFSYIVYDKYGNSSPAATVSLTVGKNADEITFADMEDREGYNHAIAVCEKKIMSGAIAGGDNYFYPDTKVSRVDFVVMAMKAAGRATVSGATGFSDEEDISLDARGYVAAAKKAGYIDGIIKDDELCFLPDEEITRAEAAVIADRITGGSKKYDSLGATIAQTFADEKDIPMWAEKSVSAMNALGVIKTDENGKISPDENVSRIDAAEIVAAIINIIENKNRE